MSYVWHPNNWYIFVPGVSLNIHSFILQTFVKREIPRELNFTLLRNGGEGVKVMSTCLETGIKTFTADNHYY